MPRTMPTPEKDHLAQAGEGSIEQIQQKMKEATEAWKKLLENLEKMKAGLPHDRMPKPENKQQ